MSILSSSASNRPHFRHNII